MPQPVRKACARISGLRFTRFAIARILGRQRMLINLTQFSFTRITFVNNKPVRIKLCLSVW